MTCPICKRPADMRYRPFCSRRCADVDLGRWLTGSYVVPGDTLEGPRARDPEAEEPPDDPPGPDRGRPG
ncbi:MAG: DNA gyrase inhibitor YacG [Paracoccaceae bacterium]